jgi:radical SAM/Cys-rich protein
MTVCERFNSMNNSHLLADAITTLQVNVGYKCNMSCSHCHLACGPGRTESMSVDVAEAVLRVLAENEAIDTLDITGGAPELNPNFRLLVEGACEAGKHVIARTNLTVFFEDGMNFSPDSLADFLAAHGVEITASLPCYLEANVDAARGHGAYGKSIRALQMLNERGYGSGSSGLVLNLVYNPAGPFLSPPERALEGDYKRELNARFGIVFDRLYSFSNMPVGRFRNRLALNGELERYIELLRKAFNPATLGGLMCRRMISVGWNGNLYDCDFNQALGIGLVEDVSCGIEAFDRERLQTRRIALGDHCHACTAGQGLTCTGAITIA